jgi:hypothetical protein
LRKIIKGKMSVKFAFPFNLKEMIPGKKQGGKRPTAPSLLREKD